MRETSRVGTRNHVAKELWTPKFRQRVVKSHKENKNDWRKELEEYDFTPEGLVND